MAESSPISVARPGFLSFLFLDTNLSHWCDAALSSSGESIAYADELALVEDMIEYVINYPDDQLTLDQVALGPLWV
jgi:hypothetical protein